MAAKKKIKGWITRGGKHIPIYEGDMALKNGKTIPQKYRKENTETKNEFKEEFKKGFKEGIQKGKEERAAKQAEKDKKFQERLNMAEETKKKQIASNKEQADQLNGKSGEKSRKKEYTKGKSMASGKSGTKTGTKASPVASGLGRSLVSGSGGLMQELNKQGQAATKSNKSKDGKDIQGGKYDEMKKKKKGRK